MEIASAIAELQWLDLNVYQGLLISTSIVSIDFRVSYTVLLYIISYYILQAQFNCTHICMSVYRIIDGKTYDLTQIKNI